jgi:hypothetical protein
MNFNEKRKFDRVKICYPISYSCIDLADTIVFENSGYALDISQGGLRLGITNIISTDKILLIANDQKKLRLKSRVKSCGVKRLGWENIKRASNLWVTMNRILAL